MRQLAVKIILDHPSLICRLPEKGMGMFVKLNPAKLPDTLKTIAEQNPELVETRVVLVHISFIRRWRFKFPNCRLYDYEVKYNLSFHARAVNAILGPAGAVAL